jgi:hypothetical protein
MCYNDILKLYQIPLRNFQLMEISTILKYGRLHTKSSCSIYLETFPILNCCSNNSNNVYFNITVIPLKLDIG